MALAGDQYDVFAEITEQRAREAREEAEQAIRVVALVDWRLHVLRATRRHYGLLGDSRDLPTLRSEEETAPSPDDLGTRTREYLQAIRTLKVEESFRSVQAYCEAIAKKAPKADGASPSPSSVRDWLDRFGLYERGSGMTVGEVRDRAERRAEEMLGDSRK